MQKTNYFVQSNNHSQNNQHHSTMSVTGSCVSIFMVNKYITSNYANLSQSLVVKCRKSRFQQRLNSCSTGLQTLGVIIALMMKLPNAPLEWNQRINSDALQALITRMYGIARIEIQFNQRRTFEYTSNAMQNQLALVLQKYRFTFGDIDTIASIDIIYSFVHIILITIVSRS